MLQQITCGNQLADAVVLEELLGLVRMNGIKLLCAVRTSIDQNAVSATGVVLEEPRAVVDVAVDDDPGGVNGGVLLDLGHGVDF